MEIRDSKMVNGKGIFATKTYSHGDVIHVLSGEIFDHPTRETIYIGNNKHIYDSYGIFINHSFSPNIYIDNFNLVALQNINIGDELVFNYNDNEINMACPFLVSDVMVSGKST